jgi:hypothetical protein
VENENCTLYDLEYSKKKKKNKQKKQHEKLGKLEIHTLGPGIWQERLKNVENEK